MNRRRGIGNLAHGAHRARQIGIKRGLVAVRPSISFRCRCIAVEFTLRTLPRLGDTATAYRFLDFNLRRHLIGH
jgi:hypothetical protein